MKRVFSLFVLSDLVWSAPRVRFLKSSMKRHYMPISLTCPSGPALTHLSAARYGDARYCVTYLGMFTIVGVFGASR
ncbi:hypothetical protein EDD15DRAFT_1142190 [Pisolithus albus]|nr:hypothetical protein EDD15DRAFT_1142190 [Pisolithus albus]